MKQFVRLTFMQKNANRKRKNIQSLTLFKIHIQCAHPLLIQRMLECFLLKVCTSGIQMRFAPQSQKLVSLTKFVSRTRNLLFKIDGYFLSPLIVI